MSNQLWFLLYDVHETRRLRGDLTEVFKILKGYENIDQEVFLDMSQSSLRGHSFKLNKKKVRLDVAKFSFSNRVVGWKMNAIPWTMKLFRDVHWLVLNGN